MFNGFWRYRYLLWNLVSRDFKLKYRRSVLGVLWSVLNPLLMCLVYWAVFSSLMDMRGSGIDNFPVFLMCGQLLFNFFNEATSSSMSSVLSAAPLLKKVYIPKYMFPLEKCLFACVNLLFSMVAVLIVMAFSGVWPTATFFLFPFVVLLCLVFAIGMGLLLSSLTVFFRDIMHLYGVVLTAWMSATPIIYPLDLANLPGIIVAVMQFNPMYYFVTMLRDVLLYNTVPSLSMWLCAAMFAFGFLLLGLWCFKKKQDRFVLYV